MPHTQSFQGGIKRETILRLARPWPPLFTDEKKAQGGATGELTPSRFQCSSDLVCDYLKFRPSENHQSQAMFWGAIYSPVLYYSQSIAVSRLLGERRVPAEVAEIHIPPTSWQPWQGRCETATSAFTPLPSTFPFYFWMGRQFMMLNQLFYRATSKLSNWRIRAPNTYCRWLIITSQVYQI